MSDREQARTELAELIQSLDLESAVLESGVHTICDEDVYPLIDNLLNHPALVLRALGMEPVGLRMPKDGTDGVWVEPPPDSGAET